jgi:signal transduction histidine kinase
VTSGLNELENLLNFIPYYLLVVNADTERIIFCNRELALSLGFSDPQEICGKTIEQCFSPENAQHITQQYRRVLQSGKTLRVQESIVLQDGQHYFDTTISPLTTSNGKFYGLLHTCSELPDVVATIQEALSQRTAQLEAANTELESFSYSVSHDLQAPLRVINGFSQVIWDNYSELLDDRGKHYLQRIQANSKRMSESIDALLQLSRVTRTQMHLSCVNLSEIVTEIARELTANNCERVVEFKITPEIQAKGDPMLLRIVLTNLLDNAWKYTSKIEFAKIEFGSISENDRLTYFVRDNGAGFNPEYAQKLFKAFQRLHSEAEFPGMGIGLATVKRVIYRHGGKVWATGECDRGASFYFTL